MHGQFVWYELTTPDVAAAKNFYPPIAGWGTQQFDKDYTMWTTRGVPFAGIFQLGPEQRQKGIPPNWMPYVDVDNVDETARKATSLGGKTMHGPQDIPNTGRFAVLQDPQGAVFGVYKSNRSSQAWDGTPVVGRFSWHELMTTDYKKAFDFYRQLFRWEKTGEMDMDGGNPYFMFGMKGKMFGGIYNRDALAQDPATASQVSSMQPFWLVYIHVKDVKKAVETATRAGAFVQRPPMEIPGGMIAIMGDPQGAAFAVHHQTAQAADSGKPAAKAPSKAAAATRPAAKATRPAAKSKSSAKKSAAKKSTRKTKATAKRRSR
jgi:predicted enzyme related to lactoylglutathione lyase